MNDPNARAGGRGAQSRKYFLAAGLLGASTLAPLQSLAWDGFATGRIETIEVTTAINNYAFRVWLVGAPTLCSGGHPWAYVDGNGNNYKTFVATLLSAQARGASVSLYTTNDASGVSYCRIDHMAVSG